MKITDEDHDRYQRLQQLLTQQWEDLDISDEDDRDILVIPSFSIDQRVGKKVAGFLHYEERLLFSLIRLRNPQTRLVYITAQPLSPIIVDYYLQMLPGVPFSHARERLFLLTTYDGSLKPLTEKILERPRLVAKIKDFLRPNKSYMVCFNSTDLEQELSLKLNIPLLASNPQLSHWGSKSGSREIFANCQLDFPDGSQLVHTTEELIQETTALLTRQPHLNKVVIKLNEGFSGEGNAVLDVSSIKSVFSDDSSSTQSPLESVTKIISQAKVQGDDETWQSFSTRIPELGVIVEAFIEGEVKYSPSVQGYINPAGEVEILSTHDQILGGDDGQVYLGCSFPARDEYRLRLQELGLKVGQELAKKGAIERYGVDFLAVKEEDEQWTISAIEINLRKGGTTHPFMTLKFLTNGDYNYDDGLFYSLDKKPKYYLASDNLQKPQYHGLLPYDLMDIIAKHRLHFDSGTRTGTVFHLIGALSEFGKLGLTSIGNSWQEAEEIYHNIEHILDEETSKQ